MPRVRFLVTRTVQDGTGTTFVAGEEYDLPPRSADRWVLRNLAVRVPEPVAAEAVVAQPALPLGGPRLEHAGGGLWHVLGADGDALTAAPLPEAEALAEIDRLAAPAA